MASKPSASDETPASTFATIRQSVCTRICEVPPAQREAVTEFAGRMQEGEDLIPSNPGVITTSTALGKHQTSGTTSQTKNAACAGKKAPGHDLKANSEMDGHPSIDHSSQRKRKRNKAVASVAALVVGLASLGFRIAEFIAEIS